MIFAPSHKFSFVPLFLISCYHIHIRFFLQNLCHMLYNLRILLQIRINDGQICSGCIMKSCINSGFFSKILESLRQERCCTLHAGAAVFYKCHPCCHRLRKSPQTLRAQIPAGICRKRHLRSGLRYNMVRSMIILSRVSPVS